MREIVLEGSPTVRVKLGREYAVQELRDDGASRAQAATGLRTWMFVPKDEQSSAVFGIGPGGHRKTERDIAKMYEGATVAKVAGTVAAKKVEWWHYRDSQHLYSTCYTSVADRAGVEQPIYIELVANTSARLSSLEDGFSGIELE